MTLGTWTLFQTALAAALLLAGVVNDLKSRRVRNELVLASLAVGLLFMLSFQGLSGLGTAALSFMTAAVAILPLYVLRVLGGGDVKLFLAVSVLLGWKAVLVTLFGAILWGAILGVVQILVKGQGKAFAHNILAIANRAKLQETQTHKIPFTIALFFGFLSSLVSSGVL